MKLLKTGSSAAWREREPEHQAPQRESSLIWQQEFGGISYRLIDRAGCRIYQRRDRGELPGDWRWRDVPRQEVLGVMEADYTGVARS